MRTSLAAAILALCTASWAAGPEPVIQHQDGLEWKASGSLPPGTEYHLIFEDPSTHAVEMLVRYAKGYVLPAHAHTHDETIVVLKGRLKVDMAGKSEVIGPGSYVVIPGGIEHSLVAQGWSGVELVVALNGPFDVKGLPPVK